MCHLWVPLHQQMGLVTSNYKSLLNENQISVSFLEGEVCAWGISSFCYKLTHIHRALFCVKMCIYVIVCVSVFVF